MSCYRVNQIVCGLLAIVSACLLTLSAPAQELKAAEPLDVEGIDRRIDEIQPTAKEHRFDAIGWVSGLRAAERLAREHGRPVFLFSNVGQMDIGRC